MKISKKIIASALTLAMGLATIAPVSLANQDSYQVFFNQQPQQEVAKIDLPPMYVQQPKLSKITPPGFEVNTQTVNYITPPLSYSEEQYNQTKIEDKNKQTYAQKLEEKIEDKVYSDFRKERQNLSHEQENLELDRKVLDEKIKEYAESKGITPQEAKNSKFSTQEEKLQKQKLSLDLKNKKLNAKLIKRINTEKLKTISKKHLPFSTVCALIAALLVKLGCKTFNKDIGWSIIYYSGATLAGLFSTLSFTEVYKAFKAYVGGKNIDLKEYALMGEETKDNSKNDYTNKIATEKSTPIIENQTQENFSYPKLPVFPNVEEQIPLPVLPVIPQIDQQIV